MRFWLQNFWFPTLVFVLVSVALLFGVRMVVRRLDAAWSETTRRGERQTEKFLQMLAYMRDLLERQKA